MAVRATSGTRYAAARAPSGRMTIRAVRAAPDRLRTAGRRLAPVAVLDIRKRVVPPARRLLFDEADAVHVFGPQHAASRGCGKDRARLLHQGHKLIDRDLLLGVGEIDF